MDRLLRPGMRLLHRLTLTGRFVAMALVLVVPLSILSAGVVSQAVTTRATDNRELQGLAVTRPLAQLVTDLYQWRIATVAGQERVDLTSDVRDMDAAVSGAGRPLGLDARWAQVREQVVTLTATMPADGASAATRAELTTTTRMAVELLDRVANDSRLVLDSQLDSYYLLITLIDRLPALLDAAATSAESLAPGRPSAAEAAAVVAQVTVPARRLTRDLTAAIASTSAARLDGQLRSPTASLQDAVTAYTRALAAGPQALHAAADPGWQLTAAADALADTLADQIDHIVDERSDLMLRHSSGPILLALLALGAGAYLFVAFARLTSGDAREVLEDINSLTTGALHQTRALDGVDEFAQMSRAAVVARDRLTSLIGELRFQATHDELTGLANRAQFTDKLTEALAEAADDPARAPAVAVVDLEGVADVNDSFGPVIGGRLLRSLGARVHRAVRRGDLVARLGPARFGVLIIDAGDGDRVTDAVASVTTALQQPVDVDGRLLRVRVTAGVATAPTAGTTATEILRNAEVAVRAANGATGGALAVFEPAMHEATRERTELSLELVQALERGELAVHYQPIVDLQTQVVTGVEALLRWSHPTRGTVSPAQFVPLAEATGLIVPIGRWVMGEAIRQLAGWRAEFPERAFTMDVNLSADQLVAPGLVDDVLSLIEETGVDPASIVLEITESALVQDFDTALHRLGQLAAVGVRLALDDFGTGYSSLSYLLRLPIDVLKVDKSFVWASDDGTRSAAVLLRSIVNLGTSLGMEIVAEGIETPEHARRLREAGCTYGQGYLWSRPVASSEFGALLRRGPRLPGVPRPRGTHAMPPVER